MTLTSKRTRALLPILALAVASLLSVAPLAAEGDAPGKEIFVGQKCNLCHSVSTAGIEAKTSSEKLKGPDIAKMEIDRDPALLASFLKKETAIDDAEHKRSFKGTDEELATVVDWLLEQQRLARQPGQ